MSDWLRAYHNQVNEFPRLDGAWFSRTIALARAGNEEARKRIIGSTLRLVLEVADELVSERADVPAPDSAFAGLIETGNAFLADYLNRSANDGVEAFCSEVRTMLRMKMTEQSK